jgi:hypothetical protein
MIERFLRTTSLKIGLKDLFKNVSEAYEYWDFWWLYKLLVPAHNSLFDFLLFERLVKALLGIYREKWDLD